MHIPTGAPDRRHQKRSHLETGSATRPAPPDPSPGPTSGAGPSAPGVARLYLINPSNPLVSILDVAQSRWNRFRVWKPLGLMVIAGLTPEEWEVTIIDENLGMPDYGRLPRPDLVGITAFTSQADRAYALARHFRERGVPVVLGGIHATMCQDEARAHVDTVVTGEAEAVWGQVLQDAQDACLQPLYEGHLADLTGAAPARHDLLPDRYVFGSIQTTRGCPLSCSFCSVTSFNGARFRQRPISEVVREFEQISERLVLVVDDNLIGTRPHHIERAKRLFRALIESGVKKAWVAQSTINVADDDELLSLAAAAGCKGLFIGFESPRPEDLKGVCSKSKLASSRELSLAVRRIQRHGILVAGSFIIGLEGDRPGIGARIADTAEQYGIDLVNVLFLTPLPGTRLWADLAGQDRVALHDFPQEWRYFTLTFPVACYSGLTARQAVSEMLDCSRRFYSIPRMLRRLWCNLWRGQSVIIALCGNLSYRGNIGIEEARLDDFLVQYDGIPSGEGDDHAIGEQQTPRSTPTPAMEYR